MECVLDHIVLNVVDEARMIAFYTEVLQLEAERMAAYRRGRVPFPSVRLNQATIIDLFPKRLWQHAETGITGIIGQSNLNHLCLALEKTAWAELKNRLAHGGVPIEEGPATRWGAQGAGTSIYFRDPDGNLIEARYYEGSGGGEECLLGT